MRKPRYKGGVGWTHGESCWGRRTSLLQPPPHTGPGGCRLDARPSALHGWGPDGVELSFRVVLLRFKLSTECCSQVLLAEFIGRYRIDRNLEIFLGLDSPREYADPDRLDDVVNRFPLIRVGHLDVTY